MYSFKTAVGNFNFPSDYSELTVRSLNFMLDNINDHAKILQHLTGLDMIRLSMIDISDLDPFFEFMKQPLSEIEPIDFVGDFDLSFDLREKTYGQKIKASQHIQDNEPLELLATYCECDSSVFLDMSVSDVYGAVNHLVSRLIEIDKERHNMLHVELTMEQQMAGISDFDKLGEFNTIDMIARNYNYTHKQVEELEYNVVLLILYRSKIQANFDKKYNDIIRQRNT